MIRWLQRLGMSRRWVQGWCLPSWAPRGPCSSRRMRCCSRVSSRLTRCTLQQPPLLHLAAVQAEACGSRTTDASVPEAFHRPARAALVVISWCLVWGKGCRSKGQGWGLWGGGAGHVVIEAVVGLLCLDVNHAWISGVSRQLYAGCTCTSAMEQSISCLTGSQAHSTALQPCKALMSERVY